MGCPAREIGAKFSHDTEVGIVSDIKCVGEGAARPDNCCRTSAELWRGGIEGIFDSFFHSVAVRVCVERSGCGETQPREVLLIGGEGRGGLASV